MAATSKSNEIRITRVYDAPVAVVWDAFTDPEQVAQWWGPRGFTLTTHAKELRPGGIWHYTMHGPDGVDYPNKTLYHEVEECRKLVYDHGAYDDRPPLFRVTVSFAESARKTTMDMTMALPSVEAAEATRKFVKQAGGNATWDRLAEFLDETQRGKNSFVINRSFAAPIDRVFDMWSDPAHLSSWLPPAGFDMKFRRADIRTGGECFFRMSDAAGFELHARFEYLEVTRPCRIVYVQRFCDANEQVVRHPGMAAFPEVLRTTVLFASEGEHGTRVTVAAETYDGASAEEVDAFRNERTGMTRGWTGSFDELDALLTTG
jgi:uncharacterized protein YndB with AHSA1/START domain